MKSFSKALPPSKSIACGKTLEKLSFTPKNAKDRRFSPGFMVLRAKSCELERKKIERKRGRGERIERKRIKRKKDKKERDEEKKG